MASSSSSGRIRPFRQLFEVRVRNPDSPSDDYETIQTLVTSGLNEDGQPVVEVRIRPYALSGHFVGWRLMFGREIGNTAPDGDDEIAPIPHRDVPEDLRAALVAHFDMAGNSALRKLLGAEEEAQAGEDVPPKLQEGSAALLRHLAKGNAPPPPFHAATEKDQGATDD